jgi:hypothetical protein
MAIVYHNFVISIAQNLLEYWYQEKAPWVLALRNSVALKPNNLQSSYV